MVKLPLGKQGRPGASRVTIRQKPHCASRGGTRQTLVVTPRYRARCNEILNKVAMQDRWQWPMASPFGLCHCIHIRNPLMDERRFMTHYLVVTAIGTDRPGIVNEVTRHVSGCGCNIVDSRLGIFGNEFTFIMLLSGDWNSLMQLEISLPLRSQEWDLITMMKRTERHQSLQYDISANAEILIRDQPGIVSQCTQFFSDHGWDIQAMQTITLEQQPFNLLKASFQLNLAKQERRLARRRPSPDSVVNWAQNRSNSSSITNTPDGSSKEIPCNLYPLAAWPRFFPVRSRR